MWWVGLSAFSGDPAYHGLSAAKSVTANDNDIAGVITSGGAGSTTEAGGTRVFSVRLRSQPSAAVAIAISSSDTTEGTALPEALGFAPAN